MKANNNVTLKKVRELLGSRRLLCVGIEGTAHTLGVGIVSSEGEILANVKDEYVPLEGGIHPREAAQHHSNVVKQVIASAIETAGINIKEIGLVAFSQGPGLAKPPKAPA
ncbi:MAG: hypothetical protein QXK94_01495 [Candidatus Jordarchaeales archaeon]